jgi:hypothetical protein
MRDCVLIVLIVMMFQLPTALFIEMNFRRECGKFRHMQPAVHMC